MKRAAVFAVQRLNLPILVVAAARMEERDADSTWASRQPGVPAGRIATGNALAGMSRNGAMSGGGGVQEPAEETP